MSAQNTKPSGVFSAIAGLFGLSILAGILVTALVTPAIAITSMTAKGSIGVFNSLPSYLELSQLSTKNVIYGLDDFGNSVPIAQVYDQNREEVKWDEVSQFLKDAVVAGEDRRFYEHGGVDVASVIRAAVGNVASSEIESGASTLTMQLVKNIKIMDALNQPSEALQKAKMYEATEQSVQRKLLEMKLAIGLEKKYEKDEIMLGYLNIAGFGGNTYGVQAAAKQFFSVPASDVTLAQAASLIAIVQYPSSRSLNNEENFENNKSRRDFILGHMLDLGYITPEQHAEAVATPIEVAYSQPQSGCMYATTAPFFCDYVTRLMPEIEAIGASPEERQANWKRGGYSVYTSLQINQQDHAQHVVLASAPVDEGRMQLGAALSVVEPGTGRIRAMAQNKYFNNSQAGGGPTTTAVNFNTDRPYGGSSGFQSGSTYKIYTLATWLKTGHGLNEVVNGARRVFDQSTFEASCLDSSFVGTYDPPNYAGSSGSSRTSVLQATIQSYNISYITMAQKLDQCAIRDTAAAMGVHRADGGDLDVNPSAVLGINELAPLTMAASVATIGANGLYCKPTAIDNVVDTNGNELGGQTRECSQALSPEVSAGVAYALKRVVQGGTGSQSNPRDGVDVVGKTGTNDNAEDTWMVGTSSTNALAVWVGNINGDTNLGRLYFAGARGDSARHRIFKPVMTALNGQYGGDNFTDPPRELLSGQGAIVPNVIGQSQEQAKALIQSLGFQYNYGGTTSSSMRAGLIASSSPGPGASIPRGSTVSVYGSLANVISMPDVLNDIQNFAAAKNELGGSFTDVVQACEVTEDEDLVDKVIASNPAPGARVVASDRVTLTVAKLSCS